MADETKIKLGYTAVSDFATTFVARDEGYFKSRGLDVEPVLIALNSTIPAALLSDSVQIGGPTPSVFLQAVDGGLGLVAIAGTTVNSKDVAPVAVVGRAGIGIEKPADFIGRKVGTPGFGAYLHVLFRLWLAQNGVDPKQVQFVEVTFPTMNDVLKAGTVDAVLTAEPIMSRIVGSGTGYRIANDIADLPEGQPVIIYATTREWAAANPATVAAFKAALGEAAVFVANQPDRTRAIIGRYIKLPPELLAQIQLSRQAPQVTVEQLAWRVDVMRRQEMLQGPLDPAKLVAP